MQNIKIHNVTATKAWLFTTDGFHHRIYLKKKSLRSVLCAREQRDWNVFSPGAEKLVGEDNEQIIFQLLINILTKNKCH